MIYRIGRSRMNRDPYALFYDFYAQHYDHELKSLYLEAIHTHLRPSKILEMGCGPAFIGIELAQRGFDVLATDISPDFLALAKANAKAAACELEVASHNILDPIPFAVDHMVMGFDVINHCETLDQFAQVISHMHTALPAGGMVFFDVLKCAYIASMIGYEETLELKGETLNWRIVKGPYPCSFRHRLERDGTVSTLNQRSFDAATLKTLLQAFQIVDQIELTDRTVYLLKK